MNKESETLRMWVLNDEGMYRYFNEAIKPKYNKKGDAIYTKEHVDQLAEIMEDCVNESIPNNINGFYLELLTDAINEIDFQGVAANFLDYDEDDVSAENDDYDEEDYYIRDDD